MLTEESARVLDYMPRGKSSSAREGRLAQVLGESYFTLLEIVPKAELKPEERISLGKDGEQKVEDIKARISFGELTANARGELESAVDFIVGEQQARFLEFFNTSASLSLRMHQVELLPGVGPRNVQEILAAREQQPFQSFEDITKRVPKLVDPAKCVVRRILLELRDERLKHYLFVRPPRRPEERRKFRG